MLRKALAGAGVVPIDESRANECRALRFVEVARDWDAEPAALEAQGARRIVEVDAEA